jgi:hypothetical protein
MDGFFFFQFYSITSSALTFARLYSSAGTEIIDFVLILLLLISNLLQDVLICMLTTPGTWVIMKR